MKKEKMKEYRITLIGCDAETEVLMEITEAEHDFLLALANKLNAESTFDCMPTMAVEEN